MTQPQPQPQKQAKTQVVYRLAEGPEKRCGTCTMFQPEYVLGFGRCTSVQGLIHSLGVCDIWEAKKQ